MDFKSKKAVSEVLSFILITLVIVSASLATYLYSKSFITDNIAEIDLRNFEKKLSQIDRKITQISTFDNSVTSFNLEFKSGFLQFKSNQIIFESDVRSGQDGFFFCNENLCYYESDGLDSVSINLSSNVVFSRNISLNPGNYLLTLKYLKNESEIFITFK